MFLTQFPKMFTICPVIYASNFFFLLLLRKKCIFISSIRERKLCYFLNYWPFTTYLRKVNEEHVGVDLTCFTNKLFKCDLSKNKNKNKIHLFWVRTFSKILIFLPHLYQNSPPISALTLQKIRNFHNSCSIFYKIYCM